jgi:hypothetical protein
VLDLLKAVLCTLCKSRTILLRRRSASLFFHPRAFDVQAFANQHNVLLRSALLTLCFVVSLDRKCTEPAFWYSNSYTALHRPTRLSHLIYRTCSKTRFYLSETFPQYRIIAQYVFISTYRFPHHPHLPSHTLRSNTYTRLHRRTTTTAKIRAEVHDHYCR